MVRHALLLVCALLLFLGTASSTWASQAVYMSPRDLGDQATLVVRGRVESVDSFWNGKHTKIFTRTRVAVDEAYKGGAASAIDLLQLGGVVGTVKVTVQGALQWRVGEEVLVFAEPAGPADFRVMGFAQGKFTIERDPATGAAYVEGPPLEGVTLVGAPADRERARSSRRLTLEQFIGEALSDSRNPEVER